MGISVTANENTQVNSLFLKPLQITANQQITFFPVMRSGHHNTFHIQFALDNQIYDFL